VVNLKNDPIQFHDAKRRNRKWGVITINEQETGKYVTIVTVIIKLACTKRMLQVKAKKSGIILDEI